MYNKDQKWLEYDGPYFNDKIPTKTEFVNEIGPKYYANRGTKFLIMADTAIIGIVTSYFDDGSLMKWLEFGIVIFDSNNWNKGYGNAAAKLFVTYLFLRYKDIARVGFSTWSGNKAMIALGEKLQMKNEAIIRKVRYYKDTFYDAVKYGVLRTEWQAIDIMLFD